MKKLIVYLIALLLTACNDIQSDQELTKKIVGTWSASYPAKFKGDISAYGEGTYYSNGDALGWNKITLANGEVIETKFVDKWVIKEGKLIITPGKRYEQEYHNLVVTDEIKSIDDKQMILINSEGKELIRNKVK